MKGQRQHQNEPVQPVGARDLAVFQVEPAGLEV